MTLCGPIWYNTVCRIRQYFRAFEYRGDPAKSPPLKEIAATLTYNSIGSALQYCQYKKISVEKFYPTKFALYYVTESGRVFREVSEKFVEVKPFLRGGLPGNRYHSVNVSIKNSEGRTVKQIRQYVHRLVAEALVDNPHRYTEVDHIDNDKHNNCVSNLRWCDRQTNQNRRNLSRNSKGEWVRNDQ